YDLLLEDIPVRGAISKGPILRETIGGSVFIAGRAVVEAYQFEQQQDWVGVMLAPSAVQSAPVLGFREIDLTKNSYRALLRRGTIDWPATIQPWPKIPFHGSKAFAGYAVVPHSGIA